MMNIRTTLSNSCKANPSPAVNFNDNRQATPQKRNGCIFCPTIFGDKSTTINLLHKDEVLYLRKSVGNRTLKAIPQATSRKNTRNMHSTTRFLALTLPPQSWHTTVAYFPAVMLLHCTQSAFLQLVQESIAMNCGWLEHGTAYMEDAWSNGCCAVAGFGA